MTKRVFFAGLICLLFAAARPISAQVFGVERGETPAMEIGANYVFIHANAPPGQCGCFSINGGGGTIAVNAPRGISLVADLSGGKANAVAGTSQRISLFDYLFGPRYSYRRMRRVTPYVEGLVGGSSEFSNYAYVQQSKSNAFAALGGGGVSVPVSRLIGLNAEVDYIYSQIPNAANNEQNSLRISTGIFFRFGPR